MKDNKSSEISNITNLFEDMFKENKDMSKYFDKNMEIECSSRIFKCRNVKDFQDTYKNIKKALPDFKKIPEFISEKDDKIFILYRNTGTHSGDNLYGFSPTNKKAEWYSTSIYTMKNGLITKIITILNELDLCKQYGWDLAQIC